MRLDDPRLVRVEYETEARFERRSLYGSAVYLGRDPREHALLALHESRLRRLLDAGCGTGEFAERARRVLGLEVVGVDQSDRMVALTRARGLEAHVADVESLPFADGAFDAVSATWMLYHVPDLDRGLAELARVLRPGGRLVAITNSEWHLEELWGRDEDASFSAENGTQALRRRFARVERRDVHGAAVFASRDALRGYLSGFELLHGRDETDRAEQLEVPLRVTTRNAVFLAEQAL